jgi:hypothetical protein
MSNNIVFLDSFSGAVADLKPRQRGDIMTVLSVLERDPNVSTWDMDDGRTNPIWRTIAALNELGYVKEIPREYPWHRFEVTELGKKTLNERRQNEIHA